MTRTLQGTPSSGACAGRLVEIVVLDRTYSVGVDEYLTSAPLVEEDTGEGADEGVGQEEHREGPRHGRRRGLALGREEDECCQCGLEESVSELPGQADGE